ncbi:WD repeat-containing protein 76 [Phytophthora citrophthora]|uniref:WD repeat-containing protein 76 n=1 Tax=Phytophthora citrophthora TaxID=4793 RepID=A0AAD9LR74_9STRA|nr:WD repeat-containing protein 76 [Phytophthora citrophthora]
MGDLDRIRKSGPRQTQRTPSVNWRENINEEDKNFLKEMAEGKEQKVSADPDNFDRDIVAPKQKQIKSLAFLPRADRVLLACGDNTGCVALWPPSSGVKQEDAGEKTITYQPHLRPVSQLLFTEPSKLLSASTDGGVRMFDLNSATYSSVKTTNTKDPLRSLALSSSSQVYYAGCGDGGLRVVDLRAGQRTGEKIHLHKEAINSVHQHPHLEHCVVTASSDHSVRLWDARKFEYYDTPPLINQYASNSVNCAYFSPNGEWLVTVCRRSRPNYNFCFRGPVSEYPAITVYDTSTLSLDAAELTETARIGVCRFSTSKLKAAWEPKRPNLFAAGCFGRPRRTQIFQADKSQPVRELVSDSFDFVTSDLVFHPHLELIAGCTDDSGASGKLALWRGKKAASSDESKVKAEKIEIA